MGLYEKSCLPRLINFACGSEDIRRQRERVVGKATGRVLEVGMGSGLNLPFYDSQSVEFVWGLEPSEGMRKMACHRVEQSSIEIRWLDASCESVPLENESVDTALLTYTLCTIPDWLTALREIRRVLKPGGNLIFCEHGAAPDQAVRRWQDRLNPFWQKIAGGCNLNRPIPRCIEEAGFEIVTQESGYLPGPKFASFNYWGTAL